jgi:hypothetical protein
MEELPVDFTQVNPIPLRKTVLLINNFMVSTTKFLNHFSVTCEDKLMAVRDERRGVRCLPDGILQNMVC